MIVSLNSRGCRSLSTRFERLLPLNYSERPVKRSRKPPFTDFASGSRRRSDLGIGRRSLAEVVAARAQLLARSGDHCGEHLEASANGSLEFRLQAVCEPGPDRLKAELQLENPAVSVGIAARKIVTAVVGRPSRTTAISISGSYSRPIRHLSGLASTLPESASERLRAAGRRVRGAGGGSGSRAARPRGTLSTSRKTRTSVAVGKVPGIGRLNRPLFLSRMPGWMPQEMTSVWPSGQFLTVCSRWVWVASGTSMDVSTAAPISRGAITLVRCNVRTVLTVRSILASTALPSKVNRGLSFRTIPSSSFSGRGWKEIPAALSRLRPPT